MVYTPDPIDEAGGDSAQDQRRSRTGLRHTHPDWQKQMDEWEAKASHDQPEWTVLRPEVDDISTGGSRYLPQPDGSFLALGFAPSFHRVKFKFKTEAPNIRAFRLEAMADSNLPCGGPGRAFNGGGVLTEFEADDGFSGRSGQSDQDKIRQGQRRFQRSRRTAASVLSEQERRAEDGWSGGFRDRWQGRYGLDSGCRARFAEPNAEGGVRYGKANSAGYPGFDLPEAVSWERRSRRCRAKQLRPHAAVVYDGAGCRCRPSTAKRPDDSGDPGEQRSPAQVRAVFSYWRTTVPAWQDANQEIAALWRDHPEGTSQLVLRERDQVRETHILKRGDFLQPDRAVQPGVPAFLHPLPPGEPPNRLTFAKWLVDRKSPTTARSIVNRVWQAYFGTGIVATSENFGTQWEAPSHPELLDWLAGEFMDSGWSLKKLNRLIVMSATYRQSSNVTPELEGKDPGNRLLARGPRFRVDAELVRDIALDASGLLNAEVGGPSVHPPAPAFLFVPPASYATKYWNEDHGTERYRRALYTFRFSGLTPYPILQAFDAPNGDSSCVRRARSNTPLQALATLNETLSVEAARALALRTSREGGTADSDRVSYAFRLGAARKPSAQEQDVLLALLHKQGAAAGNGLVQRARDHRGFCGDGQVAAAGPIYTERLGRRGPRSSVVVLNLDETITKE